MESAPTVARSRRRLGARSWAAAVLAASTLPSPPPAAQACRPHHVRLYVYSTAAVRPRHAAVVAAALDRRAKAHVSAFRERGGAPVLAVGPVARGAFHWRWRDGAWDRNTSATRAWPFVAVLEYDGRGEPRAWIDWFRRARNSRDGGAWTKDPADQRYARHMSDAYATDHDEHYAYLAVVDTPTGGVISGNEWVVRGRVEWRGAGVRRRAGLWVRFDPRGRVDDWVVHVTPLVEWRPVALPGGGGFAGSKPAGDPDDDDTLAVFGTSTVFALPAIPDDVTPARGSLRGDGPTGVSAGNAPAPTTGSANPATPDPDTPPAGR